MGQTAIPAPQVNARPITDVAPAAINIMPAGDTISQQYGSDAVPTPSGPSVSIVDNDGSM